MKQLKAVLLSALTVSSVLLFPDERGWIVQAGSDGTLDARIYHSGDAASWMVRTDDFGSSDASWMAGFSCKPDDPGPRLTVGPLKLSGLLSFASGSSFPEIVSSPAPATLEIAPSASPPVGASIALHGTSVFAYADDPGAIAGAAFHADFENRAWLGGLAVTGTPAPKESDSWFGQTQPPPAPVLGSIAWKSGSDFLTLRGLSAWTGGPGQKPARAQLLALRAADGPFEAVFRMKAMDESFRFPDGTPPDSTLLADLGLRINSGDDCSLYVYFRREVPCPSTLAESAETQGARVSGTAEWLTYQTGGSLRTDWSGDGGKTTTGSMDAKILIEPDDCLSIAAGAKAETSDLSLWDASGGIDLAFSSGPFRLGAGADSSSEGAASPKYSVSGRIGYRDGGISAFLSFSSSETTVGCVPSLWKASVTVSMKEYRSR